MWVPMGWMVSISIASLHFSFLLRGLMGPSSTPGWSQVTLVTVGTLPLWHGAHQQYAALGGGWSLFPH